jgi:hypothetical protein
MNGQTLHVVTFDPFDDRASMGGFDWFYSEDSAVNRCLFRKIKKSRAR